MKILVRSFLINVVAIWAATFLVPGISYEGGAKTLALIALVFGVVNIFVKPIIKILALPVELFTLGLFSIIINAAMLCLTASIIHSFHVNGFQFAGFSSFFIIIKPTSVPVWGTAIIGSTLIGAIITFLHWLTD